MLGDCFYKCKTASSPVLPRGTWSLGQRGLSNLLAAEFGNGKGSFAGGNVVEGWLEGVLGIEAVTTGDGGQ
jgi:hypothetical protein